VKEKIGRDRGGGGGGGKVPSQRRDEHGPARHVQGAAEAEHVVGRRFGLGQAVDEAAEAALRFGAGRRQRAAAGALDVGVRHFVGQRQDADAVLRRQCRHHVLA